MSVTELLSMVGWPALCVLVALLVFLLYVITRVTPVDPEREAEADREQEAEARARRRIEAAERAATRRRRKRRNIPPTDKRIYP